MQKYIIIEQTLPSLQHFFKNHTIIVKKEIDIFSHLQSFEQLNLIYNHILIKCRKYNVNLKDLSKT